MRAAVVVAAVLVVAALAALFLIARGEDDSYRVRAIFDNAGFIIPGEDVKIAGVKVGSIDAVEVTEDFKAAIVLKIDDPGYQDFREDASCIVRPQSLIGERFVECSPTQTRGVGAELPPPLEEIGDGPGEGQVLLPVENTSRAVDLDEINNIMRQPYRQRFGLILNELGIAMAGRGEDLNAVIRRANPALKEVDEVLALLAEQNEELERLAVDSDTIMAPLARDRERVASSIENMSEVAEATASRREDLETSVARLPAFLRELRPTMTRLGALSDEMRPVLAGLNEAAPDINRVITQLGPFSEAATPALDSLGEAGQIGGPALERALPVIRDTKELAADLRPVAATLADVLVDFQREDGIERFLDYVFFQATAVNGFDSFGHYLRAGLLVNQCTTYATTPVSGCSAKFLASASSAGAEPAGPRDPVLEWTRKTLAGEDAGPPPETAGDGGFYEQVAAAVTPAPSATPSPAPAATPEPAPAPAATPAPAPATEDEAVEPLLDYLFGGEE